MVLNACRLFIIFNFHLKKIYFHQTFDFNKHLKAKRQKMGCKKCQILQTEKLNGQESLEVFQRIKEDYFSATSAQERRCCKGYAAAESVISAPF